MCIDARLARCPLLMPSSNTRMTGTRSALHHANTCQSFEPSLWGDSCNMKGIAWSRIQINVSSPFHLPSAMWDGGELCGLPKQLGRTPCMRSDHMAKHQGGRQHNAAQRIAHEQAGGRRLMHIRPNARKQAPKQVSHVEQQEQQWREQIPCISGRVNCKHAQLHRAT